MVFLIIVGLWLICSFLAYGFSWAYVCNVYAKDAKYEQPACIALAVSGPFGLIQLGLMAQAGNNPFKYGMRFRKQK